MTTKSEAKPVTMRNHCEIGRPVAGAAGDRAQDEAARDQPQLDHRLVLEDDAVAHLEHEVADDDPAQLPG